MFVGLHTSAADNYEQKAGAQRKLGGKDTAQQRANMDLAPIFNCIATYMASGGDSGQHKQCLDLVGQFEKRSGESFEKSRYPVEGLKKMVADLKQNRPVTKYTGSEDICVRAGGANANPGCRCPDGPFIRPDKGVSCSKVKGAGFAEYCGNSNGRYNGGCLCETTGYYMNPYVERCPYRSNATSGDESDGRR